MECGVWSEKCGVKSEMRTGIFVGSFNPFTIGHDSIVRRALPLFDRLVIGVVGDNVHKPDMPSAEERMAAIRDLYADEARIEVKSYNGLATLGLSSRACAMPATSNTSSGRQTSTVVWVASRRFSFILSLNWPVSRRVPCASYSILVSMSVLTYQRREFRVYSLQFTVYGLQFTVYGLQFTV